MRDSRCWGPIEDESEKVQRRLMEREGRVKLEAEAIVRSEVAVEGKKERREFDTKTWIEIEMMEVRLAVMENSKMACEMKLHSSEKQVEELRKRLGEEVKAHEACLRSKEEAEKAAQLERVRRESAEEAMRKTLKEMLTEMDRMRGEASTKIEEMKLKEGVMKAEHDQLVKANSMLEETLRKRKKDTDMKMKRFVSLKAQVDREEKLKMTALKEKHESEEKLKEMELKILQMRKAYESITPLLAGEVGRSNYESPNVKGKAVVDNAQRSAAHQDGREKTIAASHVARPAAGTFGFDKFSNQGPAAVTFGFDKFWNQGPASGGQKSSAIVKGSDLSSDAGNNVGREKKRKA
uniref:Uncharacterized protein n=1 Tax=Kalanchoe fedtschenkoi TaxID=63787 RepID=A0A7N0UA65_KALFE